MNGLVAGLGMLGAVTLLSEDPLTAKPHIEIAVNALKQLNFYRLLEPPNWRLYLETLNEAVYQYNKALSKGATKNKDIEFQIRVAHKLYMISKG